MEEGPTGLPPPSPRPGALELHEDFYRTHQPCQDTTAPVSIPPRPRHHTHPASSYTGWNRSYSDELADPLASRAAESYGSAPPNVNKKVLHEWESLVTEIQSIKADTIDSVNDEDSLSSATLPGLRDRFRRRRLDEEDRGGENDQILGPMEGDRPNPRISGMPPHLGREVTCSEKHGLKKAVGRPRSSKVPEMAERCHSMTNLDEEMSDKTLIQNYRITHGKPVFTLDDIINTPFPVAPVLTAMPTRDSKRSSVILSAPTKVNTGKDVVKCIGRRSLDDLEELEKAQERSRPEVRAELGE
jgi:hypothetical protein